LSAEGHHRIVVVPVHPEYGVQIGVSEHFLDTLVGRDQLEVAIGAYRGSNGMLQMAIQGSIKKFLGVYSEQMQTAEIGGVWKAEAVMALYDSLP
jgi:hypothetical protein